MGEHKFGSIRDIEQMILEKVGKAMDEFLEAISDSSIGLALRERYATEAKAEGIAEGIAEGKIEGEMETRRYLLGKLWRKRFGQELDATLLGRIAALSPEQFDRIFDAIEDGVLSPELVLALLDA